jgi:UDP-N-acetylglucosamine diphosphorylase/glucosamine-1-phosphate N-acetyltransferase
MTLVFVDDAVAAALAPFSLTRPACELRAGAELVRRRWESALGVTTSGFVGAPHLRDFDEPGATTALSAPIPGGSILVNARCAIALVDAPRDAEVWRCGGRIAAVRLRSTLNLADGDVLWQEAVRLADRGTAVDVEGRWIERVWDLVRHLPDLLARDIPVLADAMLTDAAQGITRLGPHPVYVERGATLEPHVVVDAMAGPVLVRRGAVVHAFTRLVGPCLIGEDTIVHGGRIASSAIGEYCRVAGEVSTSVFTGHANKAHDGFIGHSVLGRWVNLGASTVGSNLKNNYGDVSMWTPEGMERTGMQFLGAMLGDHAKTAIGTRLTTGAVIGAGANVLGAGLTPKVVPPFAWGVDDPSRWDLEPFLVTAARVMKRRHVTLTEKGRRYLTAVWTHGVGND